MKQFKDEQGFTWKLCAECGPYIECADCKNNCCNGTTGTLHDGTRCGCKATYARWDSVELAYFDEIERILKNMVD